MKKYLMEKYLSVWKNICVLIFVGSIFLLLWFLLSFLQQSNRNTVWTIRAIKPPPTKMARKLTILRVVLVQKTLRGLKPTNRRIMALNPRKQKKTRGKKVIAWAVFHVVEVAKKMIMIQINLE